MPALQTTYGPYLAPAFAGMVADMRPNTVLSREVEGNVSLPFGAITLRGATDHGCGPIGLSGARGFLGVSVFSASVRPTNPTLNAYAPAGNTSVTGADTAAICTRGPVWVNVTAAVNAGDAAYYDASGNITNSSTSTTAIPNGVFETTTAGAGLAILVLR